MAKKSTNKPENAKESNAKEHKNDANSKPEKETPVKSAESSQKSADQEKALPKRNEEFMEWLNDIINRAGVLDYRYNLKGCGVWMAYGYKIRKFVLDIMRNLLESTPIPHDEYLFPLLVPEDQFMKEAEHVKGFENEVYWVTHGGLSPLEVKLALRPTSETVMYPMFALWIRSHQDLPLKTYQIVNTFRYEGKNTHPLIRVREITTFKEAHTCHATKEDCENQIREGVSIYKQFFDSLGIPYIISKRPKWDTFPGADYTLAFDCIFPGNRHRTLQIGTVHNLGTTFGKTFDIKFQNMEGKTEYVYQTCYGISERSLAALFAIHGDDTGLILPANIAPIQCIIIPIIFKGKEQTIISACEKLENDLKKAGIRAQTDKTDTSTGKKYYYWEMKGVPLRIEIGPKDLEKNQICIVRRDIQEKDKRKTFITRESAITKIQEILNNNREELWNKAKNTQKELLLRTTELNEALDFVEKGKGVAEIPFCGDEKCATEIEKRTDSLKFLGLPEEYLEMITPNIKEESNIFCVNCSNPVKHFWRIARSF